ncbi:MAG: hypothetical protein ACXWC4_23565 [Telluria sp.]
MKPSISLPALALAAVLAGCAGQQVGESQYVPAQGGPGYGANGDANNVPGQRPPPGAEQPQGSSGSGVSGSGNAGTYGAGESGSAPASTGGSAAGASTGSADMQKMCALEQRLKAAHSEQERQFILDQAMPGTTPDLRQQHLEMLRQHCH